MPTKGGGLKQIIVQPAGVPGTDSCAFSDRVTVSLVTTTTRTIIEDVGELLFRPMPASVSLEFQDETETWNELMAAGGSQWYQFFSDGSNLSFANADTSTTRVGEYYVIG